MVQNFLCIVWILVPDESVHIMENNECIMKTYGNVICAVVSSFLLSSGVNSNCRSKLNYTVHYRLVFQVCRQIENTNCLLEHWRVMMEIKFRSIYHILKNFFWFLRLEHMHSISANHLFSLENGREGWGKGCRRGRMSSQYHESHPSGRLELSSLWLVWQICNLMHWNRSLIFRDVFVCMYMMKLGFKGAVTSTP